MEENNLSEFELDIIQRFSKFILKFSNIEEFIKYIKANSFKINGFGLNDWMPFEYQISVNNLIVYSDNNKQIENKKLKTLYHFYYIAKYLKNKSKKVGFFPLDKFIKRIKSLSYKKNLYNIDKIDLNDLVKDMEKSGRFFIYWNTEQMLKESLINKKYLEKIKRMPLDKLTKEEKEKYQKLLNEAMKIYNRTLWSARSIITTSIKSDKDELGIIFFKKSRINYVKMNKYGQLKKCGTIINPYTGVSIPANKIENVNRVIKLLQDAIKISPNRGSPYKFIGRSYQFLTLYDEAIKYYELAIKINPWAYRKELGSRIEDCKKLKKENMYFVVEKSEE